MHPLTCQDSQITDNHEGVGWKLVIPEVDQEAVAYSFEKEWPLGNLPAGVYTLRVEAIDHERNEAFDEVTIYVGMEAPEDPDTSGGNASSGDDDSDDSDDSDDPSSSSVGNSGDADGEGTDGGQFGGDDKGCACSTTTGPMSGVGLLSIVLLVKPRRRLREP